MKATFHRGEMTVSKKPKPKPKAKPQPKDYAVFVDDDLVDDDLTLAEAEKAAAEARKEENQPPETVEIFHCVRRWTLQPPTWKREL